MQAAEAKAYYGLTHNYEALKSLVEALLDKGSLTGAEVRDIMAAAGTQPFQQPYLEGFGWGRDHHLTWPGKVGACAASMRVACIPLLLAWLGQRGRDVPQKSCLPGLLLCMQCWLPSLLLRLLLGGAPMAQC